MKKTIILIQGPELPLEERLKQYENITGLNENNLRGIDEGYEIMKEFFSRKEYFNFFNLGDSREQISREKIRDFLIKTAKNLSSDETKPLLIIACHGVAATVVNSEIQPHFMVLDIHTKEYVYTGTLFKMIKQYLNIPVECMLLSCQSGTAQKLVHLLKKDSELITFSQGTDNINSGIIKEIIGMFKSYEDALKYDFSLHTLLKLYLLKCGDKEISKSINISKSGEKFPAFNDFCEGQQSKTISLDNLKEIYEEFKKFSYQSKTEEYLKSDELTIEEIYKYIAIRPANMLQYKKFNTPMYESSKEELEFLINNMSYYSRLDEAIYAIVKDRENVEFSYPYGFWNPYNIKFDTNPPYPEIMAVLYHLYTNLIPETLKKDWLVELQEEIKELNNKLAISDYNQYIEIISENTGFNLAEIGGSSLMEDLNI